jgi:hypothetical protein
MAVGTNTNTPIAINQLGATNLNIFAGPIPALEQLEHGIHATNVHEHGTDHRRSRMRRIVCQRSPAAMARLAFTDQRRYCADFWWLHESHCRLRRTGWACQVNDITTNSTSVFLQKQTGGSTTSAVLQNFSDVAVATAPTANDIWRVSCHAY